MDDARAQLIERAARAYCVVEGWDPDAKHPEDLAEGITDGFSLYQFAFPAMDVALEEVLGLLDDAKTDLAAAQRQSADALSFWQAKAHKSEAALAASEQRVRALGEGQDAVRQQGQREGWAAAQQWLRDRGAQKPRASLWDAASSLADQMDHVHQPARALLPAADGGSGEETQ